MLSQQQAADAAVSRPLGIQTYQRARPIAADYAAAAAAPGGGASAGIGRVGLAPDVGTQALADPLRPAAAGRGPADHHAAGPGDQAVLARNQEHARAAAAAEARLGNSVVPRIAAAACGEADCMGKARATGAAAGAGAAGGAVAPCSHQSSRATLRRADIHLEQAAQLLHNAMSDRGEESRKAQQQQAEKVAALKAQLAAAEAARDEANQKNIELKQQLTQAEADHKAMASTMQQLNAEVAEVQDKRQLGLRRELQQKQQLAQAVQREQALEKGKAEALQREQQMQRQLDEEVLCQICMEHKRDTVLMPCMHLLYCHGCIQGQTARAAQGHAAAAAAGGGGGGAVAAGGLAAGNRGQQQQRSGRGVPAVAVPAPLLPCPVCRVPITGHIVALLASR